MQEKIDLLKERLDSISSVLGEGELLDSKLKSKKIPNLDNISDAITFLNSVLPDSSHILLRESLTKSN